MLNNTYIEGLSQLVSILFQDNIVRLLVFVIVGLASYYIYLKIKKNNALEKVTFFSLIVSTLLFIGYMLNQYANDTSLSDTNSLTVLAFKTHKEEYGYNEYIGVKLKFNKEAYFYLFSETQKKMVFPNNYEGGDVHNVEANRVINLNDAFRVENNVGQKDEKLILLASTQKIVEYEELLEKGKDSYPNVSERLIKKALKPNAFVSISYGENSEAQFAGDIISVHIKKISIVINQLDSKKMKEQEELYIDTLSSANGYVTVFEGVPNSLHRVEGGQVQSDEVFQSQIDEVSQPFGEHIIIAIYTPKKEQLTTNDFRVKTQEKKGGVTYSLEFKNEPYPYAIRTYGVVK